MRIDRNLASASQPGTPAGGEVVPVPGGGDPGELDAFARAAGPDAVIGTGSLPTRVYAVFLVDPASNDVRVILRDEAGRLIRLIPPESTAEMMAAMAAYAKG